MHIKQLECFVHLSETLSFSRTAELLYITQPTVTHQINTLEDELGLKLFTRTKRKVELTPAGISFYEDCKEILTRMNIAISKARDYAHKFESNLFIGYEGNTEVKYIADILRCFNKSFPQVHLYLKIADFENKISLFSNNNFDLIFTEKGSIIHLPDVNYEELYTGKYVCVLPEDHILTDKKVIRLDDLVDQPLILLNPLKSPSEMARIQKEIQLKTPQSTIYIADTPMVGYTMVKADLGIAVMPDFACPEDPDLTVVPIDTPDSISYGIASHKSIKREDINGFISIAKEIYRNNEN